MLSMEFIQSIDWPEWGLPWRIRPHAAGPFPLGRGVRRRQFVNLKEFAC